MTAPRAWLACETLLLAARRAGTMLEGAFWVQFAAATGRCPDERIAEAEWFLIDYELFTSKLATANLRGETVPPL